MKALLGGALAAGVVVVACGGTAVFDAPDPKACGTGHGCPMAACTCGDGSVVLDTTCELGDCLSVDEVCSARCEPFEGVSGALATEDDQVPLPSCDTFCTRLSVNGCELGCDTVFSACLAPSGCGADGSSFWSCVAEDAVITCEENVVRVQGCDATELELCQK